MTDVYFRVEAVNLDYSVYDTNDISTIRGGSFMLLDAVAQLKKDLEKDLEEISCGASAGIFRLRSSEAAQNVKERIIEKLNGYTDQHATFVVNSVEKNTESFMDIQHKLITANRLSQMQRLNIPWGNGWETSKEFCSKDGIRPGYFNQTEGVYISKSVQFRREKGRDLRNKIYREILKNFPDADDAAGTQFTNNLEDLSSRPPSELSSLDGKIAFIYADGNKFGAIRNAYCHDEKTLKRFDETVQGVFRNPLLNDVISHMKETASSSYTENNEIRLETLLWGGDEIEWVVPAWKGWSILKQLYNREIYFEADGQKVPLTHAAGIVFCHHKAPILQIRKLAHSLADWVKDQIKKRSDTKYPASHEDGDLCHYLVLESFDMLEGSEETFLKNYYKPVNYNDLLLNTHDMEILSDNIKILKVFFPRGKVYEIIEVLRSSDPEIRSKTAENIQEIEKRALSGLSPANKKRVEKAICKILYDKRYERDEKDNERSDPSDDRNGSEDRQHCSINRWFLIADLWDFAEER